MFENQWKNWLSQVWCVTWAMSCSTWWIPVFGLFESKSRGLRNVVDCNAYKCYSSDEDLLMMTTALMLKWLHTEHSTGGWQCCWWPQSSKRTLWEIAAAPTMLCDFLSKEEQGLWDWFHIKNVCLIRWLFLEVTWSACEEKAWQKNRFLHSSAIEQLTSCIVTRETIQAS